MYNELIINKPCFLSKKEKEVFINDYMANILQDNNNLNDSYTMIH